MRRISRKRTFFSAPRAVALGAIALMLTLALVLRSTLAGMLWRVAVPILLHNPLSAVSAQFHSKAALLGENDALRAALVEASAALADRDALYRENLELKSRLGRDAGVHSLLAGIILRPPATPYDTLFIDAGRAQGVAQGALVSAGGTTLIGQVDTVYEQTARVVLFSAPGESYQALLMESKAHGAVPLVIEGQGGGSMVTQVPANTAAAVGDEVVFPGVAGGLTSSIVGVEQKNGESFETLYLRLPVNPQELRFVEVLQK